MHVTSSSRGKALYIISMYYIALYWQNKLKRAFRLLQEMGTQSELHARKPNTFVLELLTAPFYSQVQGSACKKVQLWVSTAWLNKKKKHAIHMQNSDKQLTEALTILLKNGQNNSIRFEKMLWWSCHWQTLYCQLPTAAICIWNYRWLEYTSASLSCGEII